MFGVSGGDEVHGSGTRARKLAFPKSLGAPPRHDVRTGRSGGRRFSLPPALALLPGARSLLAAGPALAQGTTPAALTSLSVENGARRLILGWTAPAGPLNGYDVHYTSAKAAMAAGGAHPPAPVRRGRASARREANRETGAAGNPVGEPGRTCGPARLPGRNSRDPHHYSESHTKNHCRSAGKRRKLLPVRTACRPSDPHFTQRGNPMQLQGLNPTRILSPLFAASALRGGADDGSRDGPPPAVLAGGGAERRADRSLTLVRAPMMKPAASGQRPAASGQRPAASGQRPAASGQRPAASGQRPAASGPSCISRRPAPSTRLPAQA